mgnify:CR=1 FL=1
MIGSLSFFLCKKIWGKFCLYKATAIYKKKWLNCTNLTKCVGWLSFTVLGRVSRTEETLLREMLGCIKSDFVLFSEPGRDRIYQNAWLSTMANFNRTKWTCNEMVAFRCGGRVALALLIVEVSSIIHACCTSYQLIILINYRFWIWIINFF